VTIDTWEYLAGSRGENTITTENKSGITSLAELLAPQKRISSEEKPEEGNSACTTMTTGFKFSKQCASKNEDWITAKSLQNLGFTNWVKRQSCQDKLRRDANPMSKEKIAALKSVGTPRIGWNDCEDSVVQISRSCCKVNSGSRRRILRHKA
jgi:hypothetical protein